uniref:NADH-ubiquinone oxidoreductase chain 3 n=1 Tax=Pteria penguin TaxID=113549 RepID=A0A1P8CZ12_PTEPN|nr:NADH dehydrogenase subunit 3 [Pteria penguin]
MVLGVVVFPGELVRFFVIGLPLMAALLVGGSVLADYQRTDWAKGSPYECGFDPASGAWEPTPMPFFHLVLIFLLWEGEGLLFIPLVQSVWHSPNWENSASLFVFCVLLLVGLWYEWSEGVLCWNDD